MNTRYNIEHVLLRNLFSKDPVKVINKLLTEKNKYIYNLFLNEFKKNNEEIYFNQNDFIIKNDSIDQFEFIEITLPYKNIEINNCYMIIIAYSFNLDLYQYFVIEEGIDENKLKYKCLASWVEDNHFVYSDIKDEELDNISSKIYSTMMVN